MNNLPKIVFDAERMRYKQTGLFYYCLHLGNALLDQQPKHSAQLGMYTNKENFSLFKNSSFFYKHHSLHKHYMPLAGKSNIWHTTFQGTNYFPSLSKTKIVFTVHDINFLHEGLIASRKKYLKNLQEKLNRSDIIVTISEFVKQDLLKNFLLSKDKIHMIYNGSNVDDNITATLPANIPSQPFIFTIGLLQEKKNFHVLPSLLRNNNYILIIAGFVKDIYYKQKIINVAKKLKVDNRIIFAGAIKECEKYWYYQNCLAFVFPSLAEGFGLPVVEAMHFGKPVILSKATSLPEIGGKHAYYFDNFEEDYMSEKLSITLKDYSEKDTSEAIKNWSQKFNWQASAQKHWKLYKTLLSDSDN